MSPRRKTAGTNSIAAAARRRRRLSFFVRYLLGAAGENEARAGGVGRGGEAVAGEGS